MTTLVLERLGVDDWLWRYGLERRGCQEHERRTLLESWEHAGGEARCVTELSLFHLQVTNSWRLFTCDFCWSLFFSASPLVILGFP